MNIKTVEDLESAIKAGPYAWPGGYPVYFITSDGVALSFDTVNSEQERVASAIKECDSNGWRVILMDINWEDAELYCDHTGKLIEAAYV